MAIYDYLFLGEMMANICTSYLYIFVESAYTFTDFFLNIFYSTTQIIQFHTNLYKFPNDSQKKDWIGTTPSLITHSMVFIMKCLDSSPIWNQLLQVISV